MDKNKAFTLAEVMVVLTVIGILTAIFLPSAMHSSPDENIMKFKKSHQILYQVVRELVGSDKYYCDGDLGKQPKIVEGEEQCVDLEGSAEEKCSYFCRTFADFLTKEKVNCSTNCNTSVLGTYTLAGKLYSSMTAGVGENVTDATIQNAKKEFDDRCKKAANVVGAEIVASDGTVYYQTRPKAHFAYKKSGIRAFSPPDQKIANFADKSGLDINYKVFCLDVDGFDESKGSVNCDDKKDICPFGYGIRADGKVINGARADEWVKKDLQNKD